ncbi:MAG: queuosine precursor transporter [Patescibacteria group bacterium]
MGFNETILLILGIISPALVLAAWKFDKERLHSVILVFLILISIAGSKIVEFFGYATNTGNIFYASIFLATYFLIERYGKREGIRSLWIGVVGIVFFSMLLQLAAALISTEGTASLSNALMLAFAPASKVALASLLGYAASQSLNVYLYIRLKNRFGHRLLWLRANACNVLAQVVDSAIFFTVAFWAVVPPANIWEIMLVGFVIKVLYMMLVSPLLYLNRVEEDEGKEYAQLTLR